MEREITKVLKGAKAPVSIEFIAYKTGETKEKVTAYLNSSPDCILIPPDFSWQRVKYTLEKVVV